MPHRTRVDRYGCAVLDRKRDPEAERGEEQARPAVPAPPLQPGTLGWASAVGNQAVARVAASRAALAREEVAEEEAPEAEAQAGGEMEEEGEAPAPEELPEELPE
jgi:hypothetical protein